MTPFNDDLLIRRNESDHFLLIKIKREIDDVA
jgi:hypothetical protein